MTNLYEVAFDVFMPMRFHEILSDIVRKCELYLAHVIEQPIFGIPNPEYLQ